MGRLLTALAVRIRAEFSADAACGAVADLVAPVPDGFDSEDGWEQTEEDEQDQAGGIAAVCEPKLQGELSHVLELEGLGVVNLV